MSSVWDMILQWGSTIKVSIVLPVASRHRRDMTEKLLKTTLNPNTHTHPPFIHQLTYPILQSPLPHCSHLFPSSRLPYLPYSTLLPLPYYTLPSTTFPSHPLPYLPTFPLTPILPLQFLPSAPLISLPSHPLRFPLIPYPTLSPILPYPSGLSRHYPTMLSPLLLFHRIPSPTYLP